MPIASSSVEGGLHTQSQRLQQGRCRLPSCVATLRRACSGPFVPPGRHDPAVPRAKRMLSDAGSNVLVRVRLPLGVTAACGGGGAGLQAAWSSCRACLCLACTPWCAMHTLSSVCLSCPQVFITGHGGNEFMKFQDQQELMAADVADALAQVGSRCFSNANQDRFSKDEISEVCSCCLPSAAPLPLADAPKGALQPAPADGGDMPGRHPLLAHQVRAQAAGRSLFARCFGPARARPPRCCYTQFTASWLPPSPQ